MLMLPWARRLRSRLLMLPWVSRRLVSRLLLLLPRVDKWFDSLLLCPRVLLMCPWLCLVDSRLVIDMLVVVRHIGV